MNHDELADRLAHWNYMEPEPILQALKAVVALHRPIGKYCQRCSVNNWGEHQQEYPCDEIRAIEKELK